jgi:hypothetical protein
VEQHHEISVVNARFCLHFYLAYARSGYENNVFLGRNMGVIFLNGPVEW